MTAKDVKTWKPNCLFCTEAHAFENILTPPKETPVKPIAPKTHGFSVINDSVTINTTNIKNAIPEPIILH